MRKFIGLLYLVVAIQGIAQKQDYTNEIKLARDSIQKIITKRNIAGAAVAVAVNNKIVWSEGFGFSDLENKVRVDPLTSKFRIGSIAKSLTSTALGKLIDEQKIIIDSSIYFYVPDFPKKEYRPTLRQLAGHTAGIRHYRQNEFLISKRYNTVDEGLTIFEDDPLLFVPGTKYSYSSYGYNLLSAAMEKASSEDFLKLMNDRVFKPLKMTNTIADFNDSLISNRTRPYEIQKNSWLNSPYVDNSYKWAGGGYLSTCGDLIKLASSYIEASYLKKETIDLLTTSQKLENGEKTNYGMGWTDRTDAKGRRWYGHTGGSVGGSSALVIYPTEKVVVVILTNVSGAGLGAVPNNLAQLFIK